MEKRMKKSIHHKLWLMMIISLAKRSFQLFFIRAKEKKIQEIIKYKNLLSFDSS